MTTETKQKNKPNVVTLVVATVIVFTMLFYFFTFQVRITEKAVVTTFGNPTRVIDPDAGSQPGLYWKWPYPFQKVDILDARMRIFTGTLEQIFTFDGKSIILQTYTGWRISKPKKFRVNTTSIDNAQRRLESSVRIRTNNSIAKYTFKQLFSSQKKKSFLEILEEEIKEKVNEDAIVFGCAVPEFGFRRLVLPESTTKEVANRMKEERNSEAEKYRSEGVAKAKITRDKADADREEKIIFAEARAKEIAGEAFAEIADEYKIFAKDKKLAIWLRKLESLRNILKANRSTLLLDPSTQPFDLLENSTIEEVKSENTEPKNGNVKSAEESKSNNVQEKNAEDFAAQNEKSATDVDAEKKESDKGVETQQTKTPENTEVKEPQKQEQQENSTEKDAQQSTDAESSENAETKEHKS